MRLGVLVSGGGSNLQAILDAIAAEKLAASVAVVVSNVPGSLGLERAARAGVKAVALDHKAYAGREAFDAAVVHALKENGVDLVVLAGFMRIVTPVLLGAFPLRVVNIHPALLPAFPGVDGQGQAFRYGVRIAGCTVHLVDSGTDTGPIIAQAAVPIRDDDTEETVRARILREEHRLLPRVLQWFAEGRVSIVLPEEGSSGKAAADRPRVRVAGEQTAVFSAEA